MKKFLAIIALLTTLMVLSCGDMDDSNADVKSTKIENTHVKYEILKEIKPDKGSRPYTNTVHVLIPALITKKQMYEELIPELISKYKGDYSGTWLNFYSDRRFFDLGSIGSTTHGSAEVYGDGKIAIDAIKLHKDTLSDREVTIYYEWQSTTGRMKPDEIRKDLESFKVEFLKKHNITEAELNEIISKIFTYTH